MGILGRKISSMFWEWVLTRSLLFSTFFFKLFVYHWSSIWCNQDYEKNICKCVIIKALAPLCVQVAPRRKKSFPHDATFPQKSNIRIDCKINSPYFTIGTNLLGGSLDSRFHKLVRYSCSYYCQLNQIMTLILTALFDSFVF